MNWRFTSSRLARSLTVCPGSFASRGFSLSAMLALVDRFVAISGYPCDGTSDIMIPHRDSARKRSTRGSADTGGS